VTLRKPWLALIPPRSRFQSGMNNVMSGKLKLFCGDANPGFRTDGGRSSELLLAVGLSVLEHLLKPCASLRECHRVPGRAGYGSS
jgi:hypothetical protein